MSLKSDVKRVLGLLEDGVDFSSSLLSRIYLFEMFDGEKALGVIFKNSPEKCYVYSDNIDVDSTWESFSIVAKNNQSVGSAYHSMKISDYACVIYDEEIYLDVTVTPFIQPKHNFAELYLTEFYGGSAT